MVRFLINYKSDQWYTLEDNHYLQLHNAACTGK